jgi:hypothetical protein
MKRGVVDYSSLVHKTETIVVAFDRHDANWADPERALKRAAGRVLKRVVYSRGSR